MTTNDPTAQNTQQTTPIPSETPTTETYFSEQEIYVAPDASVFQPVADLGGLASEGISTATEITKDITKFGTQVIGNLGEFISEPSNLFQPTKAVDNLASLGKNIANTGVEAAKDLTSDAISLTTGAVEDVMHIGKELGNIWIEPAKEGEGVFEPKKPLNTLSSIGGKVLKSGVAVAGGTVKTGVNVAKKVLGAGGNLLKKGLGIFGGKETEEV